MIGFPARVNPVAILTATFVVLAAAGVPASLSADEAKTAELTVAQRTLLELQLDERYKCELDKILFSREIDVGGETRIEGRIRCTDQREIDFTQQHTNERFELRLCQPTVC